MVGLPYEVASGADVRKAPKKKLPYIQDGDRTIADSTFVIDYLKRMTTGLYCERLTSRICRRF